MIPTESPESAQQVQAEPQTAAELRPLHVRRKWIPISTAAWVVGGGLGAAFGIVLAVALGLAGVGGFLSDLANAFTEAISFALAGFAAALAQWLLFRTLFRRTRGWLLAGVLGWTLAGVLASLAYELFLYSSRLTSGDPAGLRIYAQIGMLACIVAGAAMVGACQWLALRRALARAGVWIAASAVAWSLGIGLTLLASVAASYEGCPAFMVAFPIAGGLVAAAITGETFARLAAPATPTEAVRPSGGGRWPVLALAAAWVVLLVGALWLFWSLRAPYAALAQRKLPEGCPPACVSASLSGLNLRGAYLREADLAGANLSRTQLSQAVLSRSNLHAADLQGAGLSRADLNGSDLTGADLRGADLRDAELREAILLGAIVDDTTRLDDKWRLAWEIVNQGAEGRNLSGVDLTGANLAHATLAGADLSGASLHSANLRGVDLKDANLREAVLNNAKLQGADLTGANLEGVEWLFGPEIDDTTRMDPKWRLAWEIVEKGLPGADLTGVDLSGANLHGGKLEGANLSGANLSEAVLFHTYLSKANVSKANLRRAELFDAVLLDADLSGADLSGAVLNSADLTGARLDGSVLAGARYSKMTIWPAGFVPPGDAIKMEEPCYKDDKGKEHCYYG